MHKDTSWGKVADWYNELLKNEDSYQSQVILPNLLRLVSPQKNQVILDLACGSGFFAKAFQDASHGTKIIGADISPELIAIAQKNVPGVDFFVTPAHILKPIAPQSVDTIVSVLAIQNIKEVKETFQEMRRVLKPGGKVFVVLNHPAFRIPGASSWQWDPSSQGSGETRQYRRIDEYLSEKTVPIVMHPGADPKNQTISFHRPLQYYAKLAATASFGITRIEEWISHKKSEAGPRQKEEDRMRKEIPLFMMLEYTSMV